MSQPSLLQSTSTQLDMGYFSRLMPMAQFEPDRLLELSKHIRIRTVPAGTTLFHRGDENNVVYYLMQGDIDLQVNTARIELNAKDPQAKQPVDPHNPHQFTAITRSSVELIEIDCDLLDVFASPDQRDYYNAAKYKPSHSQTEKGMDVVLKSRILQMIPPVNIKVLLEKFEQVHYRRNQIVFRQNSTGDYYYIIKSGGCAVLKYSENEKAWHVVADLGPGQGFGEEALLSDKLRNATVMMANDGTLLRLSREDFDRLIKTPVVKTVDRDNAVEILQNGGLCIDIRSADEFVSDPYFDGALNISMSELRESIEKIPVNRPLLIYSTNEQRSACAAYILLAHGFEVLVIRQ